MSVSKKSQKRKERKLKRKAEIENNIKKEEILFDIISILQNEPMDTKPNLGVILKNYVKQIRVLNCNKIEFYPEFKYTINKIFVSFLDGHELIYDLDTQKSEQYFMYFKTDEIPLKAKDLEYVKKFFEYLLQFKFVYCSTTQPLKMTAFPRQFKYEIC